VLIVQMAVVCLIEFSPGAVKLRDNSHGRRNADYFSFSVPSRRRPAGESTVKQLNNPGIYQEIVDILPVPGVPGIGKFLFSIENSDRPCLQLQRRARRRASINVVDFSDVATCQNMVDVTDVTRCQNIRKVSEHMYPDKCTQIKM